MWNRYFILVVLLLIPALATAQPQRKPRKIFISADMEGITGVVTSQQSGNSGADYSAFRRIMTEEVNATIEAAVAEGAETFVVSDAHGNKQNILPEVLNPRAELVRGDPRPLGMMQGIDSSFDGVFFIGYHAMAGTPDAVLDHTITGRVYNLRLNGKTMSEGTFNAALAGSFNVPVLFVSGDRAAVEQVKEIVGPIESAIVKHGIDQAVISVSPERGRQMIREGVTRALGRFSEFKPYKVSAPHRVEIDFSAESQAALAAWVPSISRTAPRTIAFDAKDMSEATRLTRLLVLYVGQ